MRFFFDPHDDSWVIWPALAFNLGRCECCNEVGAVSIVLTWLNVSVGIEMELPSNNNNSSHP